MKAKAMFSGKIMLVMVSACSLALSATGPMRNATKKAKSIAHTSGLLEVATPRAAPANAPCDIE